MIFCGDIAIPFKGAITCNLPENLSSKLWIGNLEGSLVQDNPINSKDRVVYNDFTAIQSLCNEINFKAFNISNNHLFDAANFYVTSQNINRLGKQYVGAGKNLWEAQTPIIIRDEDSTEYIIISFGWNAINCIYADDVNGGVNPYTKENVFLTIKNIQSKYNKKIIALFHWNYELELYPQPLDRDISHKLIDLGLFAVIGCHAHRVQGIEFYKGRPIIYGLGNFLFPQGHYMDGKLLFPEFTKEEYVVELNSSGNVYVHWFKYERETQCVKYIRSEDAEVSKRIQELSSFAHSNTNDYTKWLKLNRYHKGKLLPLFYLSDNKFIVSLKCQYIIIRDKMVIIIKKLINKR